VTYSSELLTGNLWSLKNNSLKWPSMAKISSNRTCRKTPWHEVRLRELTRYNPVFQGLICPLICPIKNLELSGPPVQQSSSVWPPSHHGEHRWFSFFFGGTGVWIQGLTLGRQVLYHLSHYSSTVLCRVLIRQGLGTICLCWLQSKIFLISVSWVGL
jgi:hypothetical protein